MIPLEQYQAEEEQSGTVASKEERLEAEARGNTERGDPYEDEHDRRCGGHGEDAGVRYETCTAAFEHDTDKSKDACCADVLALDCTVFICVKCLRRSSSEDGSREAPNKG